MNYFITLFILKIYIYHCFYLLFCMYQYSHHCHHCLPHSTLSHDTTGSNPLYLPRNSATSCVFSSSSTYSDLPPWTTSLNHPSTYFKTRGFGNIIPLPMSKNTPPPWPLSPHGICGWVQPEYKASCQHTLYMWYPPQNRVENQPVQVDRTSGELFLSQGSFLIYNGSPVNLRW